GDGSDYAAGDFADTEIIGIRYIQIAGRVHGDGDRCRQLRTGGWPVIAAETSESGSGDCGDDSVGDHADTVVLRVGDVHPAGGIDGDAFGLIELRVGGRPVVAAEANVAISRNGGDDAVGNFSDAVSQKPSAV